MATTKRGACSGYTTAKRDGGLVRHQPRGFQLFNSGRTEGGAANGRPAGLQQKFWQLTGGEFFLRLLMQYMYRNCSTVWGTTWQGIGRGTETGF